MPNQPPMQIGVFDSGVGGLTVAEAIVKAFPQQHLRYFADSIHVPYGNKSRENILAYSVHSVNFLKNKGATCIVIACNTASAVALPALVQFFPELVIIGVITPGARAAVAASKNKRIGIMGTLRTIASGAYKKELHHIDAHLQVYEKACPLLVPIIEEGVINQAILVAVLHQYLDPFIHEIDTLILGCTHYPIIKTTIEKLFSHVTVIDSAAEVAHSLRKTLPPRALPAPRAWNTQSSAKIVLYTNDLNETFTALAEKFFEKPNIVLV